MLTIACNLPCRRDRAYIPRKSCSSMGTWQYITVPSPWAIWASEHAKRWRRPPLIDMGQRRVMGARLYPAAAQSYHWQKQELLFIQTKSSRFLPLRSVQCRKQVAGKKVSWNHEAAVHAQWLLNMLEGQVRWSFPSAAPEEASSRQTAPEGAKRGA